MRTRLLVAVTLACLTTLSACGGGDDDSKANGSASSGSTSSGGSSSSAAGRPSYSPPPDDGKGPCAYPDDANGPAARDDIVKPPTHPAVAGTATATVDSTIGTLTFELDAKGAPCTVNSFVALAEQGYYDDTPCHRLTVIPGFEVLQCGDPTGEGTGGPGYTIPDELTGSETYPAGTLAMANTGQPDSGGSQFFICYGDTQLPPSYTVFGTVDQATIAAVKKVEAAGTDNANGSGDGHPKTSVGFTTVTIRQGPPNPG